MKRLRELYYRAGLADPGAVRSAFALRILLAMAVAGAFAGGLAWAFGFASSGVMLAPIAVQASVLTVRDATRAARITTSLALFPGLWLGVALFHAFGGALAQELWATPFILLLSPLAAMYGPRLSAAAFAASWVWLFSIYFRVSLDALAWHLLAVTMGHAAMMLTRFIIWRDDRRPNYERLIARYRDVLTTFLDHSGCAGDNAERKFADFERLQRRLQPILSALGTTVEISSKRRTALSHMRLSVELIAVSRRWSSESTRREALALLRGEQDTASGRLAPLATAIAEVERVDSGDADLSTPDTINDVPPIPKSTHLRRAAQVGIAAGVAGFIGVQLSDTRWVWAVITAMMLFVGTESAGHVTRKAFDNVIGCSVGVIIGVGLIDLLASTPVLEGITATVLIFAAMFFFPVNYPIGAAAITAFLGLIYGLTNQLTPSLMELRLGEVLSGVLCGVIAGRYVFPTSTSTHIRSTARRYLLRLAEAIEGSTRPAALREAYAALANAAAPRRSTLTLSDRSSLYQAMSKLARLMHLVEVLLMTDLRGAGDARPADSERRELANRIRRLAQDATTPHADETSSDSRSTPPADDFTASVVARIGETVHELERDYGHR